MTKHTRKTQRDDDWQQIVRATSTVYTDTIAGVRVVVVYLIIYYHKMILKLVRCKHGRRLSHLLSTILDGA